MIQALTLTLLGMTVVFSILIFMVLVIKLLELFGAKFSALTLETTVNTPAVLTPHPAMSNDLKQAIQKAIALHRKAD